MRLENPPYRIIVTGVARNTGGPAPRAPEWKGAVQNHLSLWQKIADQHRQAEKEALFITPEFGPPGYKHTLPFTNQPVADVWELNVYMRELLQENLKP